MSNNSRGAKLLATGEGERVEFKQRFSSSIGKTICAFANTAGGRIFLGISDTGQVEGIEITNELKGNIQNLIEDCAPRIPVSIRKKSCTTTGTSAKDILVITVKEGQNKPYTYNSSFYIRRGASDRKMRRSEVIEMIEKEELVEFDTAPCPKFSYDKHFDRDKLLLFLKKSELPYPLNEIITSLDNLKVIEQVNKKPSQSVFNNAGALFFAKDLSRIFTHTEIACAFFKGTQKTYLIDEMRCNRDLLANIDDTMKFLRKSLRLAYRVIEGKTQREEVLEIPEAALREAVINAVTHRDYLNRHANITVNVYANRVEISNYGGLPKGMSKKDFGKKSMPRNLRIAELMRRVGYIEQYGTGIRNMRRLIKQAGLPPIRFVINSFFTVILRRNNNYDL